MHSFISLGKRSRARVIVSAGAVLAVAALTVAAAACSDNNSNGTTPTAAATTAATNTATAQPSPTSAPTQVPATPTPVLSAAEKLAQTSGYFVYTTRTGDTYISIAGLFNGEPGTAKAGYPDQIRTANGSSAGDPAAGTLIAIPVLPTPQHIIPSAGLAIAFKSTVMLEPGPDLLTTYSGKVALHRVEFAPANAGFRMEYWLTDTATLSATGAFNATALQKTPLMTVACGSLVATASGTTSVFTKNGVSCSVTALQGATTTSAQLAAGLVIATQGP